MHPYHWEVWGTATCWLCWRQELLCSQPEALDLPLQVKAHPAPQVKSGLLETVSLLLSLALILIVS